MRLSLAALLPLALVFAACGECECHKKDPATAATASPGATQAPPALENQAPETAALEPTEPQPPVVAQAWRGEGATLELSVWHMRCAGCEKKVEDALKALAGVKDVLATNADSKVVVTLADASGREALKPKIRETLKELDFRLLGE